MANEITIKYSEDLRKNEIVGKVYGILRDKGLDPIIVNVTYSTKIGQGNATYVFGQPNRLPDKSAIEKMLEGININEIEVQ